MNKYWTSLINTYEIQALLYWILGVLIIHFGAWAWVGWLAIAYGWLTVVVTFVYGVVHRNDLRQEQELA